MTRFHTEPPGYTKTALSDLQGAWVTEQPGRCTRVSDDSNRLSDDSRMILGFYCEL